VIGIPIHCEGDARGSAAVSMKISKSKFCAGVQCLKRLYLLVHEPELAAEPDATSEAVIEQGREVGLLARQMFPGGVEVRSEWDLDQAIRATRELLANPEIPAIFEGAFEHDDVFVRVDILQRRRDQRWRLIEVKSTTSVKDPHLVDVAIQHRVVTGSGVDLATSCLAHVDRDYVYQGGLIDVHEFFKIKNLTHQVEGLQPELIVQLSSEFRVLAMTEAPQIPAGRQCRDPFTCEFYGHCNDPVSDDHILRLPRIHASTVAKLVALGVESIHDIPENYPLSERLRRACTSVQTLEPWYGPDLRNELSRLTYPLYYADFETVSPALPRFVGMRPYDHIAFQWSVHVQRQPGEAPEHLEFLATDKGDPRPVFISALCDVLGDCGSIVVYHQQFESQRLSDLASWLPQFSGRIKKIQQRLWDLLPIVRDHVYHPEFAGSYSLKSVLPAFVPEMTYEGMEVADGQAAGLAWESLSSGDCSETERQRKRKALLEYCGQDTLGLVRLLELLSSVRT
jgi:predicted RecB family nuclease